jgi:phage terminase large subunit-like protein
MQSSAQRLRGNNIHVEEFPQSSGRLTESAQNLFELIKSGNIVLYPDADIRLAVSRAVAKETARGWRIAKEKQGHKIDVVVALGMAALVAAQRGAREPNYPRFFQQNGREIIGRDKYGNNILAGDKRSSKFDGPIESGPLKGGYASSR